MSKSTSHAVAPKKAASNSISKRGGAQAKKVLKAPRWSKLDRVNRNSSGVDIGSREHWVAVAPHLVGEKESPVRAFGTFSSQLEALVDWLQKLGVDTVAMEATGVYWIPLAQKLAAAGIHFILVNPREARQIPGRKSDVADCQWLQTLHSYGLLRASFRPTDAVCQLRTLVRHRQKLTATSSDAIRRMQKALQEMNVQLHHVVSDIHGVTGLRIIQAILEGERDCAELVKLRDKACRKSTPAEMKEALRGDWREEHLLVLEQNFRHYHFVHEQMDQLDQKIEVKLGQMAAAFQALRPGPPEPPAPAPCSEVSPAGVAAAATKGERPPAQATSRKSRIYRLESNGKRRTVGPNAPKMDFSQVLVRLCGVDLCAVTGMNLLVLLYILAEIGVDMSHWKSAKHFASWLGLCPANPKSGGRVLSTRTRNVKNRASEMLRQAAGNLRGTESVLGEFYRRIAARKGPAQATVATARKLACLIYHLLREGQEFEFRDVEEYRKQVEQHRVVSLRRRARSLGYEIVRREPETPMAA